MCAVVEELTCVSRHRFGFDASAVRAGNCGLKNQSWHPHLSLHVGADNETYTGYGIKLARNHDFANIPTVPI
jgi:hypothetical protein